MHASSNSATRPSEPKPRGVARRWTYAVLVLALLFVLMPFLFWQSTWFGRPLDDQEMSKYLTDTEKPRKTQHALSQLGDRMIQDERSVRRWYPELVHLANHPVDEIRVTVAWVMGQDNSVPEFHSTLLELLHDANPMVRRNAALSLVRYGDAAGRDEILSMLRPFEVTAPAAGVLKLRLRLRDPVNPRTLLARIEKGGEEVEVRSSVPGTVQRWVAGENNQVAKGEVIIEVAPSPELVWEALRALVIVGEPQDLAIVQRYEAGMAGMPDQIALQAKETALAIRARTE